LALCGYNKKLLFIGGSIFMLIIPRYIKLTARSIHKIKKITSFLTKGIDKFPKALFLFIGKIIIIKMWRVMSA
jgi:hypothetical protein